MDTCASLTFDGMQKIAEKVLTVLREREGLPSD
jgi:hypothetical protein